MLSHSLAVHSVGNPDLDQKKKVKLDSTPVNLNRNMTKPAKWLCTQQRLRSAWASTQSEWVAQVLSFLHADSEDSDHTGRMPRLIWVFTGRTCHFVGFITRRLILPLIFPLYYSGRSRGYTGRNTRASDHISLSLDHWIQPVFWKDNLRCFYITMAECNVSKDTVNSPLLQEL